VIQTMTFVRADSDHGLHHWSSAGNLHMNGYFSGQREQYSHRWDLYCWCLCC